MGEGLKRARKAALATRKPMPKDRTVEACCAVNSVILQDNRRDKARTVEAWCRSDEAQTVIRRIYRSEQECRVYCFDEQGEHPVRLTITIQEEEDNAHT